MGQRSFDLIFSPCVYPYSLLVDLTIRKKKEPLPILKAAMRLLTYIFSVAIDMPEFQRQIASPNVPKFGLPLIVIVEDHPSRELKVSHCKSLSFPGSQHIQLLAIDALSVLIPLYPTLHKALHGRLSAVCLRQFNGTVGQPMDDLLARATSRLYSVLAVTGGKVGAAVLWRKSVDEILSVGWASLYAIRTTFPNDGRSDQLSTISNCALKQSSANVAPPKQYQPYKEDATLSIPLNLDRLRCVVLALCDLLTYTRPFFQSDSVLA